MSSSLTPPAPAPAPAPPLPPLSGSRLAAAVAAVLSEEVLDGDWSDPVLRYRWLRGVDLAARIASALAAGGLNRTRMRLLSRPGCSEPDLEFLGGVDRDVIDVMFPVSASGARGARLSYSLEIASKMRNGVGGRCLRGCGFASKHFVLFLPRVHFAPPRRGRPSDETRAIRGASFNLATVISPAMGPEFDAFKDMNLHEAHPSAVRVPLHADGPQVLERRVIGAARDLLWAIVFTHIEVP